VTGGGVSAIFELKRVLLDLFQMDAAMSTNEVTLNTVQAFLGEMVRENR
jgi:hypothetical protein